MKSQDAEEKVDASNLSLVEKVKDLQDRKLLGLLKTGKYFIDFLFRILLAEDEDPQQINKEELTPVIPNFAQYLIIGGGTTAMSAFKSIRAHDPTAKVC